MDYEILSRFKAPRLIPFRVTAAGAFLTPHPGLTVARESTGVYRLTYLRGFQAAPFCFATCVADGVARHTPGIASADLSDDNLVVRTYTYADALANAAFDGFILGSDGRAPRYGVMPSRVRAMLPHPRLRMFYYDGANDVLSYGRNDGTFVKTGTGLYTLTLRGGGFYNGLTVVAVTNSLTRGVEIGTRTEKSVTFETFNSSTFAAADTELFLFILGSRASKTYSARAGELLRTSRHGVEIDPFEYNLATPGSMARGGAVLTGTRTGAGNVTIARKMPLLASYSISRFGLVSTNGAVVVGAVNTRTRSGFDIDAESDDIVYGLDIAFPYGRLGI